MYEKRFQARDREDPEKKRRKSILDQARHVRFLKGVDM